MRKVRKKGTPLPQGIYLKKRQEESLRCVGRSIENDQRDDNRFTTKRKSRVIWKTERALEKFQREIAYKTRNFNADFVRICVFLVIRLTLSVRF